MSKKNNWLKSAIKGCCAQSKHKCGVKKKCGDKS